MNKDDKYYINNLQLLEGIYKLGGILKADDICVELNRGDCYQVNFCHGDI